MLERISIVLVEPSHPGNIGAAARAMKTMGLSRLILVSPKRFPCAEATERAASADDILSSAKIFDSLEKALAPMHRIYGTSARQRYLQWPQISPDELPGEITQIEQGVEVALVFGRENSGLSNEELQLCHKQIVVDTNPDYSSLNLAMAVQIICYELRKNALKQQFHPHINDQAELVTANQMEQFYQHLEKTLTQVGFFNPEKPKLLMTRLRRLFNRAGPDDNEMNILRGILTAVNHSIDNKLS